jgi:regulator of protease activity HflC (stomatin/prohibitin superfamily)
LSRLSFTALMSAPLPVLILYALIASGIIVYVAQRALGKRGKRLRMRYALGLPVAAVLAVVVLQSLMVVDAGTTNVVTTFGRVQERRYDPGVHVIVPGSRKEPVQIRRQIFELAALDPDTVTAAGAAAVPEAQRTLALSSDRIALSADLTFPYQLNADLAWKVSTVISPAYEASLLIPAARAAVREAAAAFTWTDAVTTKRTELEKLIHTVFKRLVEENLVGSGFTADEAAKSFVLMAPQIRRLAPPKAILAAVSDRTAAEVNLERQGVLNQIAEREAERRGNEGLGIRKLVEQLPKEINPVQLKDLLYALADKQRADSMLKAVERDQVKVMVMGGGGGGAPAIVAPPVQ